MWVLDAICEKNCIDIILDINPTNLKDKCYISQ